MLIILWTFLIIIIAILAFGIYKWEKALSSLTDQEIKSMKLHPCAPSKLFGEPKKDQDA